MADIASLHNIFKTYPNGIHALTDFSLDLEEGRCTTLLGPNGAGKTTAIKILAGLLQPDAGHVQRQGKTLGLVLQEIGLWPELTVRETLEFTGQIYRMDSKTIALQESKLLEMLDLDEHAAIRIQALSEGLKRRVNLGCALIHQPEILILDEPSIGLDVHGRLALWGYLERLMSSQKITLLLSTHDMQEAERLSHFIAILHHGKRQAFGSLQALSHGGTMSRTLEDTFINLTP